MAPQSKVIHADTLREMLSRDPELRIVDVREPVEYQAEKIEKASNVPLSSFAKNAPNISADKPVYLLCRSGNRASQAAGKLCGMGREDVYVIEGGLEACKRSGIPVTKGVSRVWEMDRQVRFAAGTLVVAGIILSWFLHPAFIGLSAFVGAGLVFSGATNTCGMAMMLARMPWNQAKSPGCSIHKK